MSKKSLTDKQLRFAKFYIANANGKQAAIKAGYAKASAEQQASRLLKDKRIQKLIDEGNKEILEEAGIEAKHVIAELGYLGLSNIQDYYTMTDQAGLTLKPLNELTRAQAACVSEVSKDGKRYKIKLYDKNKALEMLGRKFKLFSDVVPFTGDITVQVVNYGDPK